MSEPVPKLSTNKALYALWALFWLLMIVVAVEDERGDPHIKWWEPLLWEGSSCVIATLWLMLERQVADRWRADVPNPARWFWRHIAWLPVVNLTIIVGIYSIRHAVYALLGDTYEHEGWAYILIYETLKLLLFASLWMCIIFGLESFALWRRERENLLTLQKHLAESQLAQLRAQLQPHFLFNALNTISSLMQIDVARADKLLAQLADLLRASLQSGSRGTTALSEELKLLELYAAIMQERFIGRVRVGWNVAPDALNATMPAMLLQPLLENAFKHGVERSVEPVAIDVDIERRAEKLRVLIRNTGALATSGSPGIGLRNCRERLALLYGSQAELTLAEEDGFVVARLTMPYEPQLP
jgi:hypothetical protein